MMTRRLRSIRPGFTLLETILAVALSAVLLGLIATGLELYTQIVVDRNADVVNAQLARAVLQRISSDLRAAIYEDPQEDSSLSAESGATSGSTSSSTPSSTNSTSAGTTSTNSASAPDSESESSGTSDSSADLAGSAVAAVPGLFGNQMELKIDVRGSFPHPLRYDAIVAAGGDPLLEHLLSVDRVITYYLRPSNPSELVGTPLELPSTGQSQPTTVLIRRVQTRAEAELDSQGGGSSMQSGEQLLSDQVVALEFAYHDGYDWTDSWDSELQAGLPIAVQITVTVANPMGENTPITSDNIFQTKVALPMAVLPDDTSASGGT